MNGACILIRADASPSVGVGHVMRCVALAQELASRGVTVQFASHSLTAFAQIRLAHEGFASLVVDRPDRLGDLTEVVNPDWIVVDLGTALEPRDLLDVTGRLLVVDDLGQEFQSSPDLVLNQNLHAKSTTYAGIPDGDVLRGSDYLLFRDEFIRELTTINDDQKKGVLLTLGGTDPLRVTLPFAEAIVSTVDAPLVVLASSVHPDIQQLRGMAATSSDVHLHEDVHDVARLLGSVELAVTSGGTTVWELAALGVPSLVGSVGPIEELLLAGLRERNLFDVVGPLGRLDPQDLAFRVRDRLADRAWLATCRRAARTTVDGQGRRRVVDAMERRSRR